MAGRSLAYLMSVPIERVKGLGGARGAALKAGGLETVTDLLLHVPRKYLDRSTITPIAQAPVGEEITLLGRVISISSRRVTGRGRKRPLVLVQADVADDSGVVAVTWFNQPFRVTTLPKGTEVALSGTLERFKGRLQMKSPSADPLSVDGESLVTGRVVPVHRTVGDVSQDVIRRAVHNALLRSQPVADPVPARLRAKRRLPDRSVALQAIHFPMDMAEAQTARRRLVYDEFFRIELVLAITKRAKETIAVGISHRDDGSLLGDFLASLPYAPTGAQTRTISEIRHDMGLARPMHRLLQGEVGSGKTLVAVAGVLTAVAAGHQAAIMAPTEVLATQHHLGITGLLAQAGLAPASVDATGTGSLFGSAPASRQVRVALLTGNHAVVTGTPDARRADVLAMIADGRVDVVVGTHALIQEGVAFRGLSLAVIDEQHRFGVAQRVRLREQAGSVEPDVLIMTATPIPRTLSMTLYGDLDVSVLDEMPPGRSPIRTQAIGHDSIDDVWAAIDAAVGEGRQAFVVCPMIEESEKLDVAAANEWYERLRAELPHLRVGLIHGRLRPDEKRDVMEAMRAGRIDALVATTVIEVGIDVPNATLMVIVDADRLGLNQLHQLRGRVGRGRFPGRCILVADPTTDDGTARIEAMVETTDGFVLAERDLQIRGQGSVFDDRQSGLSDLRLGDILRDRTVLEEAREDAFGMVAADPLLAGHEDLVEELGEFFPDSEDVDYLFRS